VEDASHRVMQRKEGMLTAISVWVALQIVVLEISWHGVLRVLESVGTFLDLYGVLKAVHFLAPKLKPQGCASLVCPPLICAQCGRRAGTCSHSVHLS